MKRIGMIGLGNMGFAMARNLLAGGFEVTGFDIDSARVEELVAAGGRGAASSAEVGSAADAVFVMVMNGSQLEQVICGQDGLLETLAEGSTIIVSATIEPREIRAVAEPIAAKGVRIMDTPVSGGKDGAEGGTLTMMVAAPKDTFDEHMEVLEAVGEKIFHVGEEIGMGQTVKASLQALIGATFTAIFESLVLGSKAGVEGRVLFEVFTASGVRSPLLENCARLIMDREFENTGSHISTMYKDLGITMNLARESGVAMFTTSASYELFQSGISLFPDGDNWSIVKLLEQIADTEVSW